MGDIYETGSFFIKPEESRRKAYSIIKQALTPAELASIDKNDISLMVTLIINSITGRVDEVNFEFYKSTAYYSFPLERYRTMELGLKNLTFELSDSGKELTFTNSAIFFKP